MKSTFFKNSKIEQKTGNTQQTKSLEHVFIVFSISTIFKLIERDYLQLDKYNQQKTEKHNNRMVQNTTITFFSIFKITMKNFFKN